MDYFSQLQKTQAIHKQSRNVPNNTFPMSNEDTKEQLRLQKRKTNLNSQKINSLEKEVSELKEQLREATELIKKYSSSRVAQEKRMALHHRRETPPSDEPIDRNGVAPSKVNIQDIFYAGNRR